MSKYLNKPIAYLQDSDIDSVGNLINPKIQKNKPVILLIQANYCGYCTQAKPDFQKFANENTDKVFCVTIQGDPDDTSMEGEKQLVSRLKNIKPNFKGYPDYVLYINGKKVNKEITGRDIKSLEQFAGI